MAEHRGAGRAVACHNNFARAAAAHKKNHHTCSGKVAAERNHRTVGDTEAAFHSSSSYCSACVRRVLVAVNYTLVVLRYFDSLYLCLALSLSHVKPPVVYNSYR